MTTQTNCTSCVFAHPATDANPCDMQIIDSIIDHKNPYITDSGFYAIPKYRCAFAFNDTIYRENIEKIGSIENLKQQLAARAKINYYLLIFLDGDDINLVCDNILQMPIKPSFVSFVLSLSNNTKPIIDNITNKFLGSIQWKLHNILDEYSLQDSLDTVLDTNEKKQDITYLWINRSGTSAMWPQEIAKINHVITIEQPILHAMFRDKDNDGLFIGIHNYYTIRQHIHHDIFTAIDTMPQPHIYIYA